MSKDPAEIRTAVERIVDRHLDDLFSDLDNLHRKDIDDTQVKAALVALGYSDMADWYEVWMNDGEPIRDEEDGAPRGIVIDDVNASSYKAMIAEHEAAHATIEEK